MQTKPPFSLIQIAALLLLSSSASNAGNVLFEHSSHADFAAGETSDAGQNLFISEDGSIRWIHRFDLNNNGFPDLLIPNDHNHYDTPPAIIYHQDAEGKLSSLLPPLYEDMPLFEVMEHYNRVREQQTFLPTLGGVGVATGDFNGNGFEDIAISAFVHGWSTLTFPVVIYFGSAEGYDPQEFALWDGGFVSGIATADLNNDGFADLVATGRGPEYEIARNQKLPREERLQIASSAARTSRVLYGSENAENQPKMTTLNTLYAIDVGIADLNGSGTQDLVFLEAGDPASLQFYYSSADGSFSKAGPNLPAGAVPWEVIRGRKLELADINGNGAIDVLVPTESGLKIFWNNGSGDFSADSTQFIKAPGAYAAATGDFNNNGLTDLAIACFNPEAGTNESSFVLINNGGPIDGWTQLSLPTRGADAALATDINNDGFDDLVIAQYLDNQKLTLDTSSVVFWGSDRGLSPSNSSQLATFGATDIATLPARTDPKRRDILFVNRQSGRRSFGGGPTEGGSLPLYLYWGSSSRSYSPANMLKMPPVTPETPTAIVDLNGDGNTEIIALTHSGKKVDIYSLRDGSYTLLRQLPLPDRGKVPLVADLNHDGVLDLLVVSSESNHVYHFADPLNGSLAPYSIVTPLPVYSAALGDLDGNGYLDLVGSGVTGVFTLPGSEEGFLPAAAQSADLDKFFTKVVLADFDNNGLADILAFAWRDNSTEINRTDSLIFWNRDGNIDFTDHSPVPTLGGAHQGAVADIAGDGSLDIVSSNYHGGDDRHLDLQVFHGDGSGIYSREASTTLPAISASAAQVMDFDRDGFTDILVFNHSESSEIIPGIMRGARHSVGVRIYWGSESGFDSETYSWIPTYGPHNKTNVDPGSLLNRSAIETYTSAPISVEGLAADAEIYLQISAETGPAGNLSVEVIGSREDPENWVELPLQKVQDQLLIHGPFQLAGAGAGTLQYRIRLDSNFLGTFPVIHSVTAVTR